MSENSDLIIRNARLIDESNLVDIAIKKNRIIKIDKKINAVFKKELDVEGSLVSPGFIDAHLHLDLAFMGGNKVWSTRRIPEAEKITNAERRAFNAQDMKRRAKLAAETILINGTTSLRTHVTVDQITGSESIKVLTKLKKEISNWMDIQIVAFLTEDPATNSNIGESLLKQAMSAGADVVGGLPYRDPNPEKYLDIVFKVAKEFNADIDLHMDETNDPKVLTLETLAEKALKYQYNGRVTGSHCCALSAASDEDAKRIIKKVHAANMNIIANPLTNLYLWGKDGKPDWVTRVKELLDAGVNVAYATDSTYDPFNPFGNPDMITAGLFLAYMENFDGKNPFKKIHEMGTTNAANIIKMFPSYGIKVGGKADLTVLDAENLDEAMIKQVRRNYVIKNGKIVVENGFLKLK